MGEGRLGGQRDDDRRFHPERSWTRMFADAVRGLVVAVGEEANFRVHSVVAAAAIAVGAWVELSLERWCLIVLCIAIVLAAEMANTAIEHLARAVTRESNPEVRDALDVASAAVLVAALGAAAVGVMVLAGPVLKELT